MKIKGLDKLMIKVQQALDSVDDILCEPAWNNLRAEGLSTTPEDDLEVCSCILSVACEALEKEVSRYRDDF
jgi:hypothetical protein